MAKLTGEGIIVATVVDVPVSGRVAKGVVDIRLVCGTHDMILTLTPLMRKSSAPDCAMRQRGSRAA